MRTLTTWSYAALALAGGFLGGAVATQLTPSIVEAAHATRSVKAQEFVLVDEGGKQRATMKVSDGIANLAMFDENGTRQVVIGEAHDGRSGITIYSKNKLMAGLTVSSNNEASLTLYDPQTGRARAGLGVASTGAPALALFDEQGRDRAELHVGPGGKPGLALADESGKSIAGLPEKPAPAPAQ